MNTNALAGAISLVGVGLCGIAAAMVLQAAGSRADAFHRDGNGFRTPEPTVVWYGMGQAIDGNLRSQGIVARAWSDGRVEAMRILAAGEFGSCGLIACDWQLISDPQQGYAAFSDLNADGVVDGVDLASILSDWGDAPRNAFPPSDCPLNLITP